MKIRLEKKAFSWVYTHAWSSSRFNPFSITANLLPGIDKWMNYYWTKEQELLLSGL